MDLPIYSPKTTAELLGLSPKALRSALAQDGYSAQDLWALRKALRIHPRPIGHRKQLFLNFKGGTGKTSLSTSYAYRLAELGYSVLLVDLDSQGHATKCLGYEGEDFEKTLLHAQGQERAPHRCSPLTRSACAAISSLERWAAIASSVCVWRTASFIVGRSSPLFFSSWLP